MFIDEIYKSIKNKPLMISVALENRGPGPLSMHVLWKQ